MIIFVVVTSDSPWSRCSLRGAISWMETGGVGKRWSAVKTGEGVVKASALWVIRSPSASRNRPLSASSKVPVWGGRGAGGGGAGLHREVGGTHWQPIVLHHFIKLLVNFFVFLFSARGEGEGLLGVWALRVPMLFLVQSLRSPNTRKKRRHREIERGQIETEKKNRKRRLEKVTKVWWYSRHSVWRGCPGRRSCGHLAGFGRWSHRRRARGCCSH